MKKLTSIVFLSLIWCSCQPKETVNVYPQLEGHVLTVEKLAGEKLSFGLYDASIPCFLPSGRFQNKIQTFLLASQVEKNEKLEIEEIGLVSFMFKDSLHEVIVAQPTHESKKIVDISNYNELSLNHPELKHLFENWIKTNCKEFSCIDVKWHNDFKAKLKIQDILTK